MNIDDVNIKEVPREDCWRSIDINDTVFQTWQGVRRFGVVYQKRHSPDGWAFFKVDWLCDDDYLTAISELKRFRNTDDYKNEYRCDELRVIDVQKEIKTLQKCLQRVESKNK